ncbi:MAG: class I SAM-dependent methyltransferase [Planctomycetota bacterium]|nr:MAG: class I SAM-dependent methyltransferase [Planctomycetota bacterium]
MSGGERIPKSLGASDYKSVWNAIASVREHAFELVDESTSEEALVRSGQQLAPHVVQGLGISRDDVVLEIGCGVARLGREVAPHAREYWGLDVSENMLAIARERCAHLPNARFVAGNGADLAGLPDSFADVVYCHAVLIHMDKEDLYSYLVDARRVLKPGGLFYFDVWNLAHPVGWLRWQVERTLYRSKADRPLHRNQFSTAAELRAMLRVAGWEVLHLAETMMLQPVVTHVPRGVDRARFLAELGARRGNCWEALRWRDGDHEHMARKMIEHLAECGRAPEVDPTGPPLDAPT